jgi:murein DD-endopeptidase MepM/ murein hydrolase activator NlpD
MDIGIKENNFKGVGESYSFFILEGEYMNIIFNSLPVDAPLRITSRFGKRNLSIVGSSKNHKGVDIGRDFKKKKTNLLAVADAVVVDNFFNDFRGWVVILSCNGFKVLYQHLESQSPLKIGTKVNAGQVIGVMGDSSNKEKLKISTHLHFELIVDGIEIDPEPYLENIVEKEDEEVITKTKIEINGTVKEINRILSKDGENYVRLRDLSDVITVDYDENRKLPIVKMKT